MSKRKVIKLDFHRNGISGLGFYVGIIEDSDKSRKVAIRFPDIDNKIGNIICAVLDIDLLNENIIGMFEGKGNAWRGDHYNDIMDKAIKERTETDEQGLLIKPIKKGGLNVSAEKD